MAIKQRSRILIVVSSLVLLLATACTTTQDVSQAEAEAAAEAELGVALVECDPAAGVQQCCSARGCTGKVLSNRDAHNCKVKSRGKSWHDAASNCQNL
jgi:hypothetical protein